MEVMRAFQLPPVTAAARQGTTVILVQRLLHKRCVKQDIFAQLVHILHVPLELLRAPLGLAPNFRNYVQLVRIALKVLLSQQSALVEHIITLLGLRVLQHVFHAL